MIAAENGIKQDTRSPTVTTYKNKPVIHHELIRDEMIRQFRFIYGVPFHPSLATTQDGLDGVLWADVGRNEGLRVGRYLESLGWGLVVAMVHSNSKRQKTAFYGGMRGPDGLLMFDKVLFKPRLDKLEENVEKTLSRWGLFIDRYFQRYKELKEFRLEPDEYRRLVVECARDGVLSWSRMGKFDDQRTDHETALNFLLRMSKHVGRQPVISHAPARSQPWSLHSGYVKVHSLRN